MKRSEAIVAASAAAQATYRTLGAGGVWFHDLGDVKLDDLVVFQERHLQAPAEELYRYGSGRHYERQLWGTNEALAAAVETFDAVLRIMLSRVQRDAASPTLAQEIEPREARPRTSSHGGRT